MTDHAPSVAFGWGTTRRSAQDKDRPLASSTVTQTVPASSSNRSVQQLVLYAKKNPGVQRLVSNYEEWESNLRREAETRLGGFKPLQQLLDSGNAEDWELLRRVKQGTAASPPSGRTWMTSMKRSASEGSLTASEAASAYSAYSARRTAARNAPGQRVTMRQDWDILGAAGPSVASDGGAGPGGYRPRGWSMDEEPSASNRNDSTAMATTISETEPATATPHSSNFSLGQQMQSSGPYHFPHVSTAPALRDDAGSDSEASSSSGSPTRGRLGLGLGGWGSTGSLLRMGGTATSDEAASQIEAVAARLLQQSRQAIQNAQQTLQETATNCSQNFQTLGALLGGSGNHGSGPLQNRTNVSLQIVPWRVSPSDKGAAGSETEEGMGPWSMLPRHLRLARESEASSGNGSDDGTKENLLEQVSELFERLDRRSRKKHRSLQDPDRQVAIVTTASLPWMTGTAVNPLLRAAYMSSDDNRKVTLVLPWLSKVDQERVFPGAVSFETPEDQEAFVREWAQKRTGLECKFKVAFYPGRYAPEKGSILPVGDITQVIPDHEADVAVLEEPEHLNWFHHGTRWTDKFNHVVGVMHTNYLDYARREEKGEFKEMFLRHLNAWMCRIYCHKVIKLSDAVQPLPRQETMFVHGVSPSFLRVGQAKAQAVAEGQKPWNKGVYFLGKVLWAKGYTELLQRLDEHAARTGQNVHVDVFGTGPDLSAVQDAADKRRLDLAFNGARDHADTSLQDYKVFINPSLSDVVATTTAEALAMGKFVVCAKHPSNEFFSQFPNCLVYRDSNEFSACLEKALKSDPVPLSLEQIDKLTWEGATKRFLKVAELTQPKPPQEEVLDNMLAAFHQTLTGIEALRVLAGAGANTKDTPLRVTDYVPSETDVGGWFDDVSRAKRAYAMSKGTQQQVQAPR